MVLILRVKQYNNRKDNPFPRLVPIINVTGLIIPGLSELQRSIIIHHQCMKTDSNLIQISLINFLSSFGFVVDEYSFQWKVEGYLLTGLNVPWRNRLH